MCGAQYVLVAALLALPGPSCSNSDNLVRLLDTLKPINRAVCDDKAVTLACPAGTIISIQIAQYANAASEGCMSETASTALDGVEKKCRRTNNMQYSLLQTVVEACQKRHNCTFSTKLKPDIVDPCPHAKKYVEVSYKCRPYEFRSHTGCEDDIVKLSCNPHSRIAILNAQFGRTEYESVTCPQANGVPDETCTAPYSFEKVIQLCLGKRRCQVKANPQTFESSCSTHTKPYLKVIYACVPLGVLAEKYEATGENDEIQDMNGVTKTKVGDELFDETDQPGERWKESSAVTPVADPDLQLTPDKSDVSNVDKDEEISKQSKANYERKNDDMSANTKLFLYIGVTVVILALILLIFIGIRCYTAQKQKKNSKNGDMFTAEAPNVFNDATSDIDNDVDVSHISGSFYDPAHPDMILYRDGQGSRGTLRAMKPLSTIYPCVGSSMYGNIDYVAPPVGFTRFNRSRSKEEATESDVVMSPKSLGTYSNSQFYYG